MPRLSAGLLMYCIKDGVLQVLLAHPGGPYFVKKDDGAWTIPKGEPEPEEDLLATAQREFEEVMHFHGTADKLVPFDGPDERMAKFLAVKSVEETIRTWANIDRCRKTPKVIDLPDTAEDGTTVKQESYGPGKEGTEVILFVIQDGGHTWPGKYWPVPWLGKTTSDISANDLLWEFFEKHPMK
jgi:poly(3-hydroxybutyrate) depolymerase